MSKRKAILVLVAMTSLTAMGLLLAQEGDSGRRQGPGIGPQGGPMGPWFDELEKAYEQKNMDKIGELIGQMKERRQRFAGGPGAGGPAGPPERMRGPGGGRFAPPGEGQGVADKPPVPKSEREKQILAVLDEMDRTQRRGMMNVPSDAGRLLRLLAETTGARQVVEIGTSNGYSGTWQALALKATGGKLTTFEIDANRAALARQNFKKAGVDDVVTLIEGNAHEKVADFQGEIDILFLDADKDGYIDYLNKLLPKVRPGGLIVAHNITPRQADPRYLEAITTSPDLETVFLSDGGGVSVTLKKRGLK